MFLLWLALAVLAPGEDGSQSALANVAEVRHQVSFKLIAPDAAILSVTREFAARSAAEAMRFDRQIGLPDQSVVTSFAFQSDGTWREGRLGPKRVADKVKNSPAPPPARPRPWASLEGQNFRAVRLATPPFRGTDKVQLRYTLWAQAVAMQGGRRWVYCSDQDAGDTGAPIVPEITLSPGHPDLRVVQDPESKTCLVVEKTEPDGVAPSARFGTYRLGPHAWWWRLELEVPEKVAALPTPPEAAPVVFVLDASRSQEASGGLEHQLAIVESYLANTPGADVELVLTNRSAKRVFGRFVPAGGFMQALPAGLGKRSLGNGSFLDRGVELATEALAGAGKPGRIVVMTDGGMRSRFDRGAVVATLKRAPAGTIVHVVYPTSRSGKAAISHNVPDGLDELAVTFGGGSYSVIVSRSRKDGSFRAPAREMLHTLVKPEGLESLSLVDPSSPKNKEADNVDTEWPDALDGGPVEAGEGRVWSGVSETPPPKRLALTGWVWAKKMHLAIRPDPTFEQRLARLVTSEDEVMECEESARHRKDAIAQHFLTADLAFWVAGDGAPEGVSAGGTKRACTGDSSGGQTGEAPAKPQDILPQLNNVLHRCALVSDPKGTLQVKVETHLLEILDVGIEGGEDWERQCLEDEIWKLSLPAAFNQGHSPPVEYALTLAHKKSPSPSH